MKEFKSDNLLPLAKETLNRLWCTNYGYLVTESGQSYAKKLKTIARKIRNCEQTEAKLPESVITWLEWVYSHKDQLNKILLPKFQFKEGESGCFTQLRTNENSV